MVLTQIPSKKMEERWPIAKEVLREITTRQTVALLSIECNLILDVLHLNIFFRAPFSGGLLSHVVRI